MQLRRQVSPPFLPPSNSQSSGIESLFPYYTHTRTANKTKFLLACKAEEAKFLTLRSPTQRDRNILSIPPSREAKKSRMFVREGGNRFPTPLTSSFLRGKSNYFCHICMNNKSDMHAYFLSFYIFRSTPFPPYVSGGSENLKPPLLLIELCELGEIGGA